MLAILSGVLEFWSSGVLDWLAKALFRILITSECPGLATSGEGIEQENEQEKEKKGKEERGFG